MEKKCWISFQKLTIVFIFYETFLVVGRFYGFLLLRRRQHTNFKMKNTESKIHLVLYTIMKNLQLLKS